MATGPDRAPGLQVARTAGPTSRGRSPTCGVVVTIQCTSRMRECRTYGSVRGAVSNDRPYRDSLFVEEPMMSDAMTIHEVWLTERSAQAPYATL